MIRFCYFRPNESALRKLCTSINQPYLIWAAVLCRHVPPQKDQERLESTIQKKRRYVSGKKEVLEVHNEVKLSNGEVRPAN